MTPLTFPTTASPRLTAVLVTFNAWRWTERALAALIEHTDPCYEVVVVDNASTDGTSEGLNSLENVTVVRNPINRGFGPAANQGVAVARAPYVLLLNTDALVRPGWLEPLAGILDAEPDVAAVAPRLLHMNRRLQEAGSILWRDGLILNYGDGDDPDRPEYHFRRDVDYASAACILIRRSALIAVGGFDAAYAPAYFEDVDLCQALWDRGMRTVYQPRSTVLHLRWGSTGSQDRVRTLAMANLPTFQRRWKRVLEHRPPRLERRHDTAVTLAGRDIRCPDRVLIVGDGVPDDTLGCRGARVARLIDGLARLYPRSRITYLALDRAAAGRRARKLLASGVEVAWPACVGHWLRTRRLHYDVVIIAAPAGAVEPVSAELRAAQPQAQWAIDLATYDPPDQTDGGAAELLKSAGVLLWATENQRGVASRVAPSVAARPLGTVEDADLRAAMAVVGMAQDPLSEPPWHDSGPRSPHPRSPHHGVRSADV